MRLPRFFAKKRGHRRTGAEVWGSVGEALFHAVLVVGGLAFGGLLVTGMAVPEWRINHDFVAGRARVVGLGLARRTTGVAAEAEVSWQPGLRLRYETPAGEVESWAFRGPREPDRSRALARLDREDLGREVTCWYDPDAARVVVLERGYNWWMWALTLLMPGALLAFGSAGLIRAYGRWGKSEERRAATRGGLGQLVATPVLEQDHPGVPGCDDLVNSPGTILRFRLPLESPENWTLLGFGLFAVLWNAVLSLLAVNAGLDLLGGRIDWLLLAIIVPFAAVGIAGIVIFVRRVFLTTAVGPTQLEISDHPLRPDGIYDLLLAQGGSGAFTRLELALELEEQATFRQGTDTRTERVVVWRQELGSWRDLQLTPGTRFEARAALHVPGKAMHSFASEHNSVHWRIVVRGRPGRWPAFTRSFPLVVFPAAAEKGT
ncbi:MAG: hypothetical protein FJ284_01345 [Planctomycetes bacterium]|nr:hypothetical protein [Planctomycetota bacterium]